jgi:Uma2 family endonuclease
MITTTNKGRTRHSWQRPSPNQPATTPPLEPGDRLSRAEFERRYAAMPHVKKAELIEGVVYMPSPVRYDHGKPHAMVMGWLAVYAAAKPNVEVADNATVRLDADNEFQPDALLRLRAEAGGQSRISADGYIEGAPELVVEIALSSAAYDLHDKLPVYQRTGVQEYLVWQIQEQQFDWFYLSEGRYVLLPADKQGHIQSRVFPDLHLNAAALLTDDLAAVLQTAQAAIQPPK